MWVIRFRPRFRPAVGGDCMIVRRFIPVFAIVLAVALPLAAQEKTFLFSSATDNSVAAANFKGSENIEVRPNTAREINLYVFNSRDETVKLDVEVLDSKGKPVATASVEKAAGKSYNRVRFAKAPATPPMPGAAPPPAPPPAPMGPPPPAGFELGSIAGTTTDKVGFTLRMKDEEKKVEKTQNVVVSILDPAK